MNRSRDSRRPAEKVLDSPAKSRTSSNFNGDEGGPKTAAKDPIIPKTRTGSGRPRKEGEIHNPEIMLLRHQAYPAVSVRDFLPNRLKALTVDKQRT